MGNFQFGEVRVGFAPGLLDRREFTAGRGGVALMVGDQGQSVVSAGVVGVVLLHFLSDGRCELPIVSVAGDAVEEFETEERLDPCVWSLGGAAVVRDLGYEFASFPALVVFF